jgi:hypothetical protein
MSRSTLRVTPRGAKGEVLEDGVERMRYDARKDEKGEG